MSRATIKLDDRTFIANFDEYGKPLNIKERKVYAPGKPYESLHDSPYWHHSAKLGGPFTRPNRILREARKKLRIPEPKHASNNV